MNPIHDFESVIALNSVREIRCHLRQRLASLFPLHISYWGCDGDRKRVFFAEDLSDELPFANEELRVINFGDGFLGKAIDADVIRCAPVRDTAFIAKEFIRNNFINEVAAVPVFTDGQCQGLFFLASPTQLRTTIAAKELPYLFRLIATRYSMLRSAQFQQLLIEINERSLATTAQDFLKAIDAPIREYYRAAVLSVWLADPNGALKCVHSSESALIGKEYLPGQGATGGAYQKTIPILAHRLRDLKEQRINWAGKHLSTKTSRSNPNNHAIFVPMVSAEDGNRSPAVGILRLVSYHDQNSFWPDDLQSARILSEILVLRYRNENLISQLNQDKSKLSALLQFSNTAGSRGVEETIAERSFDSTINIFSSTLKEVAFLSAQRHSPTSFDVVYDSGCGQDVLDEVIQFANGNKEGRVGTFCLNSLTYVQRFRSATGVEGIQPENALFIAIFESPLREPELPFLEILGNILRVSWENEGLNRERREILQTWERAEAATRAGLIARDFAHEVKNQILAIRRWVEASRQSASTPKFDGISNPLSKLESFSQQLLRGSNFRYQPRTCYLNDVIKDALRTYGVTKAGMRIAGHTVNLDLAPELGPKAKTAYSVTIDPDALISVIRNLLTNSMEQYEAIGAHGKAIDISTRIILDHDIYETACELHLIDYAGGVSPEIKPRMFDPFISGKPKGSGMGLYSAHAIVVGRMRGQLIEDGAFGTGASFKVILPASVAHVTATSK